MIPASFYDFERLSAEESISPKEDISTRRGIVTGSKIADRRVYEHLVPERHEERRTYSLIMFRSFRLRPL